METKKITTRIYLFKDMHGNISSSTVEGSTYTIQVGGLLNKEYESVYFESEAYHVDEFCSLNNIEMKIIDRVDDFESLWNSN